MYYEQSEQIKKTAPKKRKIIIIIVISIIIILSGLFCYYYTNYATGTLELTYKTQGVTIRINGNEYLEIKTIKLKPGTYKLIAFKDNYLESYYQIKIKPLGKTKLEISLPNMQKITNINLEETTISESIYPTTSQDGKSILFYDNFAIKKLDIDSKQISVALSLDFLKDKIIMNADWSLDKNKLMFRTMDSNGEKYWIYIIDSKKPIDLGSNVKSACFSGNDKVAIIAEADGKEFVNISSIDMLNKSKIADINNQGVGLSCSPLGDRIAFFSPDNNGINLILMDLTGNNKFEKKFGNTTSVPVSVKWSFDGQKIAIKLSDDANLQLFDRQNNEIKSLDLKISGNNFIWGNIDNSIYTVENILNNSDISQIILNKFDFSVNQNSILTTINYNSLVNIRNILINNDGNLVYILNNQELIALDLKNL